MKRNRAAVLAFARAPRLGEVKTRLAAEIGDAEALSVYRTIAEHVIEQVRQSGAGVRQIHFTPPDAAAELRSWLGTELDLVPQVHGDLGDRLQSSFQHAFSGGMDRVVVVGTDVPDLRAAIIDRALRSLDSAGAVLGPAYDGGYYLIGLRAPAPRLFRQIDWSTDQVLTQTEARLRELGISTQILDPLTDIDRLADLPEDWRSRFFGRSNPT